MVSYPEIAYEGRLRSETDPSRPRFPQPGYETIERLVHADTGEKIGSLMREWGDLVDISHGQSTPELYEDARDLLLLAIGLKSLIDGSDCARESLDGLGFRFEYLDRCSPIDRPLPLGSGRVQMGYRRLLRSTGYAGYLRAAASDAPTPLSENELCGVMDCSQAFVERLRKEHSVGNYPIGTPRRRDGDMPVFYLDAGSFQNTESGFEKLAMQSLDELATLHLHDVRAYAARGGTMAFQSSSILSALWCCLLDSFGEGRAGICPACGKPFIAFGERGNRRRYCSNACNKRFQRFKRFETLLEAGDDPAEAANAAGIRLDTALGIQRERANPAR